MGPTMINVGTAGRKDFSIDGTLVGNSDSVLPTEKAVKTYVDNSVVGLLDDRGDYDASSNLFPATGGSGTAGAILKGDTWRVSVAGTLGGTNVNINDWVRALVDTPGQTSSNWAIMAQFDNSFTDFDASTNPNYPASTKKGQRWKVTVTGKVGGVSGKTVRVGDTFESLMVSAGGTELAVGSEFIILTGYGPFGTLSLQDASNVNISGGAITGTTVSGITFTTSTGTITLANGKVLTCNNTITIQGTDSSTLDISTGGTLGTAAFTASSAYVPSASITGGGVIATGGFTLTVPSTGTTALLGAANIFTAANSITTNGAASTPAMLLSGTPFTGGSATTTKPLALIETAGATSTGWSTSGTMLGVNAPSGFTGNLFDGQVNGTSYFKVTSNGSVDIPVGSGGRFSMVPYNLFGMHICSGISGTGGLALQTYGQGAVHLSQQGVLAWSDSTSDPTRHIYGADYFGPVLTSFELQKLAICNGPKAQTLEVYGLRTDASNYERLRVSTAAGPYIIKPEAAGTGTLRDLHISGLPTSNPGPGILWNNAGTPAIGT